MMDLSRSRDFKCFESAVVAYGSRFGKPADRKDATLD